MEIKAQEIENNSDYHNDNNNTKKKSFWKTFNYKK